MCFDLAVYDILHSGREKKTPISIHLMKTPPIL